MKRKLFLAIGLAGFGLWLVPVTRGEPEAAVDEVEQAVRRAIQYLASQQNPEGAISDKKNPTAMTALSLLALAAVGHQPTDTTPEGDTMRRGLAYVLRDDRVDQNGYFGGPDSSRMYGHGIVTLMLAELLGMGVDDAQDRLIRERLERACTIIASAQTQGRNEPKHGNERGGWRYEQTSGDSDLSVSVWQLLALRAAKNAGIDISKEVIAEAMGYLKLCYRSRRGSDGAPVELTHGFTYQPNADERYTPTAMGLLAFQVCGEYDAPEVGAAAEWLRNHPMKYEEKFYFYGTYYFSQGMYQRGGEVAEQARQAVEDVLLKRQDQDGSWTSHDGQERDAGRVYCASMAILSLSVRFHYLPIYQR